jgi:hypothetical protein
MGNANGSASGIPDQIGPILARFHGVSAEAEPPRRGCLADLLVFWRWPGFPARRFMRLAGAALTPSLGSPRLGRGWGHRSVGGACRGGCEGRPALPCGRDDVAGGTGVEKRARSSFTSAVSEVISLRREAISSGSADGVGGGEARSSLTSSMSEVISLRKEVISNVSAGGAGDGLHAMVVYESMIWVGGRGAEFFYGRGLICHRFKDTI